MLIAPMGDAAITVTPAGGRMPLEQVRAVSDALRQAALVGVTDIVPAPASVTVIYDPRCWPDFDQLSAQVKELAEQAQPRAAAAPATLEIPVCYDRDFAPDLAGVAKRAGISEDEVVTLHAGADYGVQAVGFAPGFPYLGGLPERLHTPRLATPRTSVPVGSVGIGGNLTGVYPLATPGGWNLIGRTPMGLFDLASPWPAKLRVGDRVRFKAITREEFVAWQ
jgi:inhibitor of KinA